MPRAPDFFIVGQPKAGTTALHAMLRQHPQIFMPESKEPNYFARELAQKPIPAYAPTTLTDYLSLFESARPGQLTGEASIFYLWSRTAAQEIARLRPDARIIAILREPASFLYSLHLQLVQTRIETEYDFRRALALEKERRIGRHLPPFWPQLVFYSEHMRYIAQLHRYQAVFPADRVLVLIYDDYRRDNLGTLRKILRFLELDDTVPLFTHDANPTARVRTKRIKAFMEAAAEGRGTGFATFKAAAEMITTRPMRRAAQSMLRRHVIYGKPRQPDDDLMTALRRRYKPEVAALAEYLGRDLVELWGYHDIP